MLVALLILAFAFPHLGVVAQNCPGANPNDLIPDDAPLQLCLNQGGTILLSPGTPGYIIAVGLNVTVNFTTISSSEAPTQATLIAHADLGYPILQTTGINQGLTLEYLIFDGNKANRTTQNLINCVGTNNLNYRTSNIMLPGYIIDGVWNTWDPYYYVSNLLIHDVWTINSPCGAGIGVQGFNFEIYNTNISNNGWDAFNNPQNLVFPYADGLNAAVCYYGYIHDNLVLDNTNMQMTAGPGPYCRIENNIIQQTHIVTQSAINCWPTNVWMTTPVFWHPAPWDLAHSAIVGNVISSTNSVSAGAYSGISVGALPWANYTLYNTGLVYNNTISGVDVCMLVDGVMAGTIYGNTMTNPSNSSGKTSSICPTPQTYTVAKSANLFLQPGFIVRSFDAGRACFATGENIVSTVDNAKFVSLTINGVMFPTSLAGSTGSLWAVSITYINTGTSIWQDIAPDRGYKVGDAINQATPLWGVYRCNLVGALLGPGSEYTFQFTIVLPSRTGTYPFQWQMVQENINWFGDLTHSVPITVSS